MDISAFFSLFEVHLCVIAVQRKKAHALTAAFSLFFFASF